MLGVMTFANIVLKNFLIYMIVCFVKDSLNGCILNVLQYQLKSLQRCAKMIYPFFCETCEQKMSVCFKCKLSCSNLNNSLTCFLCLHKCHVLLKINLN